MEDVFMTIKKRTFLFVVFILFIIAALSGILYYTRTHNDTRTVPEEELQRLSQSSYDSVFLSMHSTAAYSEEDFAYYHGLNTLISSCDIGSMDELKLCLDAVFSSHNTPGSIFLLLDPDMIRASCGQDDSRWDKALQQGLFSFAAAHPDTGFEILLPYPSLAYWLSRDETDLENTLAVCHSFIEAAHEYANIRTFYMGSEDWMLSNPGNYVSDFDVNDAVARKIFLTCFCDGAHQVTPDNDYIFFDQLRELIARERATPTVYPDLSDRCLVFFGDSVMEYGEGSHSIPGCVSGLSGAAVYNCAVGGSAASANSPDTKDFPNILASFLEDYCVEENGTWRFSPAGADLSDKKLCFLINYGLNDYFKGSPVDNPEDPLDTASYTGGLRSSLKEYMTLFPDADFIIMTPTFTSYYSNGSEHNSEVGGSLTDYVNAARALANELNIYCIDNYHDLRIDESNIFDYSSDGAHPNEKGRMLIAWHVIRFIDDL